MLEANVPRLLAVSEADANRFGCNAVVVGKTIILSSGTAQLEAGLRVWGYEPIAVELDEFLLAGISAKRLTFRLDGEEAAIWNE